MGYFETVTTYRSIRTRRRLYAPPGDDPVVIADVTLENLGDAAAELRHYEYWDVNILQLQLQWLRTGLFAAPGDAERQRLNAKFTPSIALEAEGTALRFHQEPPRERCRPPERVSAIDWYPADVWLADLSGQPDAHYTDRMTFFGKGGASQPDAVAEHRDRRYRCRAGRVHAVLHGAAPQPAPGSTPNGDAALRLRHVPAGRDAGLADALPARSRGIAGGRGLVGPPGLFRRAGRAGAPARDGLARLQSAGGHDLPRLLPGPRHAPGLGLPVPPRGGRRAARPGPVRPAADLPASQAGPREPATVDEPPIGPDRGAALCFHGLRLSRRGQHPRRPLRPGPVLPAGPGGIPGGHRRPGSAGRRGPVLPARHPPADCGRPDRPRSRAGRGDAPPRTGLDRRQWPDPHQRRRLVGRDRVRDGLQDGPAAGWPDVRELAAAWRIDPEHADGACTCCPC